MSVLILAAALFCFFAGGAILVIKPRRFTNRVFFVTSLLAAFWLACVWAAIRSGEIPKSPIGSPFLWIRLNGIASVFWVWSIWLLAQAIVTEEQAQYAILRRFTFWLILPLLGAILFFNKYYLLTTTNEKGPLYFILASVLYVFLALLSWNICTQIPKQKGIRRVEMQFLALPLAASSVAALLVALMGNVTGSALLRRLSFIPFILGYGLSVWAITFQRLYNPKEIVISLARLSLAIASSGIVAYTIISILRPSEDETTNLAIIASFAFIFGLWIHHRTEKWLGPRHEQTLTGLRNAIAAAARVDSAPEALINQFEQILRAHSETSFASLLLERGSAFSGKQFLISKTRPAFQHLYTHTWATPEALERRRTTRDGDDLQQFMSEHSVALLVAAPRGNPAPSLVVALGEKKNRWPFTYPEVERMQTIADLIDNIVTHSRLATEAALKQRLEHLAMMSRGLAHDLKNLITPVDSFLVHSEPRLTPGTPEAEVHAAAKRSVALMTDYVREALFFANRLNPRFESTAISDVLQSAVDVTAARAARNRIHVSISSGDAGPCHVDRVLIQRMLANLLNNAIDACPAGGAVTLSSSVAADRRLPLQVSDTGAGIAPEHLSRIFEPYFTTKQFGDDVRGFGLGLTICEKIVRLHGGEISVESALGRGTVVTVDLPPEPPMPPVEPGVRAATPETPTAWRTAPMPSHS